MAAEFVSAFIAEAVLDGFVDLSFLDRCDELHNLGGAGGDDDSSSGGKTRPEDLVAEILHYIADQTVRKKERESPPIPLT